MCGRVYRETYIPAAVDGTVRIKLHTAPVGVLKDTSGWLEANSLSLSANDSIITVLHSPMCIDAIFVGRRARHWVWQWKSVYVVVNRWIASLNVTWNGDGIGRHRGGSRVQVYLSTAYIELWVWW